MQGGILYGLRLELNQLEAELNLTVSQINQSNVVYYV